MSKTEEIYRLLVNEIQDYAIFMLDRSGIVMTWNNGAERLTGYKASEIIGSHFSCFFRPEDIQAGWPNRELETALKQGRSEDEGWRVRKDGGRFWANVVLTALYDEEENHRGFAKITRDVSKRREAEIELRELHNQLEKRVQERTVELGLANRELAEANRTKDNFLATLSHELRTPLTSAFGWVQLLRGGGMDAGQQRRGLDIIDRNLRAQIKLIDDLLNVSHIAAGKIRLDLRQADALQIIRAAVDSVRPIAKEKRVDVRFSVRRGVHSVEAAVDAARLQQVFSNLLTNAVKFTPSGGRIQVRLDRSDTRLIVRVSDTGEGIPAEFMPHVFERFRQADSSQSRRHGGLGIGLSLVRQLVELHGGTVQVESAGKGQGATFIVSLPLRDIQGAESSRLPRPA
jgi:PAS domain S-box-containing protein